MGVRGKRLALLLAGGSLLAYDLALWWRAANIVWVVPPFGYDFTFYLDAARGWVATGEWFRPYQLEGPYSVWESWPLPVLYPATTLPLFLAFTVLPAWLWWAVPIVGTLAVVIHFRPPWQAWLVMLGLVLYPGSFMVVQTGNPTMWVAFAVALATIRPAFGPLVLLKLTMAPFALVGIRHRKWWVTLVVLGLVSLPFLAEYETVLRNATGNQGLLYSANHWALAAVPVVAAASGYTSRVSFRKISVMATRQS